MPFKLIGIEESLAVFEEEGASFIRCREGRLLDGRNFMDLTKMAQDLQRNDLQKNDLRK